MTNQDMSSLNKEAMESEKKLRKRERKLNEKLQDALNMREEALERLRQAEARVQKRTAGMQRLEARLQLVHQQLAAITTAPSAPTAASQAIPQEQPQPSAEAVTAAEVEPRETQNAEPSSSAASVSALSHIEAEVAQIIDAVEITGELLPEEALSAREAVFPPPSEQGVSPEALSLLAEPPEAREQIATDVMQEQGDTLAQARAARAAAEVAEREARFAAARAAQAMACLEQVQVVGGEAHHLLQEATQLQEEAEHLHALAQEKARLAQVAEQQSMRVEGAGPGPLTEEDDEDDGNDEEDEEGEVGVEEEDEDEESDIGIEEDEEDGDGFLERDALEHAPPVMIADFDAPPPSLLTDAERAMMASPHIYPPPTTIHATVGADVSRPHPPTVTEVEEDEELVETVTSMLIADAAAEAAAQAEAFAEASAARTRAARRRANQADSILRQIKLTIERGILTGNQAESALLEAERDVTNAQAVLANAEAAEAHAMEMATNAEAEAEVAEDMAFAVDTRNQDIERTRQQHSGLFGDLAIVSDEDDEYEDEEETAEMPGMQGVRPREMA